MSGRHTLRRRYWNNGTLDVEDLYFGSTEEAQEFAKTITGESVKIYDEHGRLVSEFTITPTGTYA